MSFYTNFAQYYADIFPFSLDVADFLVRYSPKAEKCLDVGCGTGHYAAYLSSLGRKVTGIDLDAAMITQAQQNFPDTIFHVMDMGNLSALAGPFDFIYCIGNSGAHLTQNQFRQFCAAIKSLLTPKGIWIVQLMNWDYVLSQERVSFPDIHTEGNLTFTRSYIDISPSSVCFQTCLKQDDKIIFQDSVPLYPQHSEDIIHLHIDQGFSLIAHFGSYGETAYNPDIFSANIFVFRG